MNKGIAMAKKAAPKYSHTDLVTFGAALLGKAGLPADRAGIVSRLLVEADLMGHVTHGLNLLPAYLKDLEAGNMTKRGEPKVISDRGSAIVWDGKKLPGLWLTHKALEEACSRIKKHPVVTLAIRKSHHIGCLAAYLPEVTAKGLLCVIASSDPSVKMVAPYGGRVPLYTPNPVAIGIPAGKDRPILIDISTSVTAAGVVNRHRAQKKKLPGKWLLDGKGNPSNDPEVFGGDPPGTILPLGGIDAGYKGFALGLFIEALTSGLGGYGRSQKPVEWGASVYIQVVDPGAFGGRKAFEREMKWLADASRENPPRPGVDRVRVPGERALALKARQIKEGTILDEGIMPALLPWAEKLGVPSPAARQI
jgi:L-lactate dehydrogenase